MSETIKENKVPVPHNEQETVINICHSSKSATVWSTHPNTIKKLYTFVNNSEEAKIVQDMHSCLCVSIPYKWVKLSIPKGKKLTDEQKAALAERLRNSRVKKEESYSSP